MLKSILKDNVTLKTGAVDAENSACHRISRMFFLSKNISYKYIFCIFDQINPALVSSIRDFF